jgi:hypothetical protein
LSTANDPVEFFTGAFLQTRKAARPEPTEEPEASNGGISTAVKGLNKGQDSDRPLVYRRSKSGERNDRRPQRFTTNVTTVMAVPTRKIAHTSVTIAPKSLTQKPMLGQGA